MSQDALHLSGQFPSQGRQASLGVHSGSSAPGLSQSPGSKAAAPQPCVQPAPAWKYEAKGNRASSPARTTGVGCIAGAFSTSPLTALPLPAVRGRRRKGEDVGERESPLFPPSPLPLTAGRGGSVAHIPARPVSGGAAKASTACTPPHRGSSWVRGTGQEQGLAFPPHLPAANILQGGVGGAGKRFSAGLPLPVADRRG